MLMSCRYIMRTWRNLVLNSSKGTSRLVDGVLINIWLILNEMVLSLSRALIDNI